jgi:soluble lytic murein transglycosylase-like protein
MRTLLRTTSEETARAKSLAPDYRTLYGDLQLATAWQETCWRQYTRSKGTIRPIRSPAGAVGLMQVNARAWRGFYEGTGLTSDVAYNARAGSEILLHYLVDLAVARGEHRRAGGTENLVRAAYAAYNGGPRQLARYRSQDTVRSLRKIDESLFKKYEAVRNGRELEVARCFG